jgi:hypothetical protein
MKSLVMERFLLVWLLAMLLGCSKTSTEPEEEPPLVESSEEAQLVALCLSNSLRPPDTLSSRVQTELDSIRALFGSVHVVVDSVRFTPPWEPSCILVEFDEETAELVLQGDYHAWDDLNEEYGITEINERLLDSMELATLHFEGVLHPRHLAALYDSLPGVRYVHMNHRIGDWSCIYPRFAEDKITYLFREGWGDCPSGCIYDRYTYFVFVEDQPSLVGVWTPSEVPGEPCWWAEAAQNEEMYWRF